MTNQTSFKKVNDKWIEPYGYQVGWLFGEYRIIVKRGKPPFTMRIVDKQWVNREYLKRWKQFLKQQGEIP